MLREVKNASFGRRLTALGWRYFVVEGGEARSATWRSRDFRAIERLQADAPVALFERAGRTYWLFDDRLYWEDEGLGSRDVLALAHERERRRRRTLDRAHAALAGDGGRARRQPVARSVRQAVWERDGGRCVECGSRFDIQYDHVIPVALGGATTVENLQILCAPCNQAKGASLG